MTIYNLMGAALAALVLATTPVLAHAELETTMPAVDSAGPAPAELRLDFSEALELAFTGVTLTTPDGTVIETGTPALDANDATILVVPMPVPLAAGSVNVAWKAVAADGHKSEGSYSFTIAP